MIVPDANLLLYAADSTSPFHKAAVRWWSECLNGSIPVGLCHPVVFAFVRVGTNARAFSQPLSLAQATRVVRSWHERRITRMLYPSAQHTQRTLELLAAAGSAGGNLVTDAQIAALAIEHHAEVHTADHDFRRFPGLDCRFPLDAAASLRDSG